MVGSVLVRPEAMTGLDAHDTGHRAAIAPDHPVGDTGDRSEAFGGKPSDRLRGEDDCW
jgi:hypothetical protein